jgi:hypothetical protein
MRERRAIAQSRFAGRSLLVDGRQTELLQSNGVRFVEKSEDLVEELDSGHPADEPAASG